MWIIELAIKQLETFKYIVQNTLPGVLVVVSGLAVVAVT